MTCVSRKELGPELLSRADVIFQLGINTVPSGADIPGMEWRLAGIAAYVAGQPNERSRIPSSQPAELGVYPSLLDLARGFVPGRTAAGQVTLFVTTGTQGLQFASVAGNALRLAREQGLGHEFPTEWFLEDIRD